ncbi:glycosyltransferase family 2 protein [Neotamlana laminarinivorans]|uniref:Glycosyltransferase n=1 Tax=Neotamlana laminarinivorans TaxID=2883124 RepID=A0A9X1L5R8_9FLAO|nr:galactosyltransferase-related protein [Tamlana laminarinivorans]MCB4799706.1 glycosyltransferase [Tamlana laminarinivorans]
MKHTATDNISMVLTNRNRDLRIVKQCLTSLKKQSEQSFVCTLVDYGSDANYLKDLKKLLQDFPKINFVSCDVSGQLWNKCRAINIALKACETPYFMVGDIDLMFHPDFIKTANTLAKPSEVHYFLYGFLSEEESKLNKEFIDYKVDFPGNNEVTGNTMFPTEVLKKLNGYDEFYHGWGAEDTDIHIRMKNQGLSVNFYDKEILVKHQWHPKAYRSKLSKHPFHSQLERINHAYMNFTEASKKKQVNQDLEWGKLPVTKHYNQLNNACDKVFHIKASNLELKAFLAHLHNIKDETIQLKITDFPSSEKQKNNMKKLFGKKSIPVLSMETINNIILEEIITKFRNNPYKYQFDRTENQIELTMYCEA